VAGDFMHISKMVHLRPEDELLEVIAKQKSISTSELKKLIDPFLEKIQWQEETLERNVETIRKASARVLKAESKIWKMNKVHENSTNRLHNRAQLAENQLERARREIAGLKMDARIAKLNGRI